MTRRTFLIGAIALLAALPGVALAQAQSLTLTVTPPLFQVTQSPGSAWRSQLKVVNSNTYDINIRVEAKDFHPDGETGNAVFEQGERANFEDPHRMSGWIEIPPGDITLRRGSSAEIPFTINVPANADPGGHYGALIVSTRPQDSIGGGSGAEISSAVTSLIFLRVPGDVAELGDIRDFYAENDVIQSPDARFVLRFENKGNVHLVPQGQIVITNMWGKERGRVNINESSTFGNVLPASTRKFEFAWSMIDPSPLEVGRYKAVATIVYGSEARNTVERTVYFWIVPWKPVASILGSLLFFVWFITWSIRRYINKALALERARLGLSEEEFRAYRSGVQRNGPKARPEVSTITMLKRPLAPEPSPGRPFVSGNDERGNTRAMQKSNNGESAFLRRLRYYRPAIVFFAVVVVGIGLIGWYFVEVFQDERAYHIEQIRPR